MENYNPLTIEELRSRVNKGEIKDPIVFLESIMNGYDLRKTSDIYNLLMEIHRSTSGNITEDDWGNIMDCVKNNCKYEEISANDSIGAAKTLAEYLHPKRKQVELKDSKNSTLKLKPLTDKEIVKFRQKFNENF